MKKLVTFGIVTAAISGVALAQPPRGPGADRDGDGVISREEFEAAHLARARDRFAALDADNDGRLTREEMRSARNRFAAERHERAERIDADGDGAWSFGELQAVRPGVTIEQFNRLDRNGDGLVTADERPPRHGAKPRGGVRRGER